MSRVGSIGASTVTVALATAVGLFMVLRVHHPWAASIVLLSVIWLPGVLMAIGSVLAAMVVSRRAPRDAASMYEWLKALLGEWRAYFAVFVWRQPFRWHAHPDPERRRQEPIIVLVHGYLCNRGFWHPWMMALQARGWAWRSVNLEPVFGSIDRMVDRFDPVMKNALATGAPVAVVAHSMGGLVIRAWLARQEKWPDGLTTCVTIGSPHQGTWLARWANSEAGREMRENSPWIERLSGSAQTDQHHRFLCWRSLTDHVVYPPANASLPGANDRVVRCAGHVDLAFQLRVMSESLDWIASAFKSPQALTRS